VLELRDVEIFSEVALQRSFSKAARELGISQPVVSETVRALEDRLGERLIDRTKRPLDLTPAGKLVLDAGRDLLDRARRLEDSVRQLKDKVVGTVRVAAIYSVGLLQMGAYVRQFERLYPDSALELRYLHPQAVIESVAEEAADLGIVSFASRRPEITCIPWQEQEIALVVYSGHRLANRSKIRARELDGESLVTYTPELQVRTELDRWLKQARVSVEISHEFDNIENIKRAVEIGSGVALLPLPTVRRELEIGSLKAIPLEDVRWVRPLGIIHKKQKQLTTAVQRFLDLLHQNPDSFLFGNSIRPSAALPAVAMTGNATTSKSSAGIAPASAGAPPRAGGVFSTQEVVSLEMASSPEMGVASPPFGGG
jgi:DNA-binding transcriptional LysR family regulator